MWDSAGTRKNPTLRINSDGTASTGVICERVYANVVKVSDGERLETFVVETGPEGDLTGEEIGILVSVRFDRSGIDIEPLDRAAPPPKPVRMTSRVIRFEAGD